MLDLVKKIALDTYVLDINDIHGINHWNKVHENLKMIANYQYINNDVSIAFAYLHDCKRQEHGLDINHGQRASEFIKTLNLPMFSWDIALLCEICELHSEPGLHKDPTIAACIDADRLEIVRVGIIPEVSYMNTEIGKYVAAKMQQVHVMSNFLNR